MRYLAGVTCLLTLLALGGGCSSLRMGNLVRGPENTKPPGEVPTVASLVNYLNDNAGRVKSLRVGELDLTCTQGLQSFGLRGKMIAEKQRNFRMSADSFGNRVVDLGSNEQEFWYWISKAQPPYQVYCSYKDLNEGKVKHMPFPFQPDWVMESMGMGPYGPPERYTLEHDSDTLRLVEKSRSPQGQPVKKVIVFKRRPQQPPYPQVTDYLLIDETSNKEICSAKISEVQIDRTTGATLPRRLELRWPAEKVKLGMKFDDVAVNPQLSEVGFRRDRLQGVQSFNLARMEVDPPNVERVQGTDAPR